MLRISNEQVNEQDIEKKVYALKTIGSLKTSKIIARWFLFLGIFGFSCLFLPWQQNVNGSGFVTSLTPQDRPHQVETAIAGRIREWKVREGDFVTRGDTLLVLDEIKTEYFDPNYLSRLDEQLIANFNNIQATENKVNALGRQISALNDAQRLSLEKAQNKYQQARLKVISDSTDFEAGKLNLQIAETQFERYDKLYKDGLISRADWESRRLKLQETSAKLISLENKYLVSQNEVINAKIQLGSLRAEYADKIAKSESERNSAIGYVADKRSKRAELENKYANVEIRGQQYFIVAPQDGYVVKALKSGIGETIKENDAIATIMPDNPSVAVELYVDAMDVPLIQKGRHVRLEFDGWPALQFSGWPSVSVGTFGGTVQVIDYVDSKDGQYRMLIVPDKDDEEWPELLRVGSGVYGWVMLDDVSVWYEIWRNLNGFPPSLYEKPDESEKDKKKSDKKIKIKVK